MNWNNIKQSYAETGIPIIIPKYPNITLIGKEQKTFDHVIKSQKILKIKATLFTISELLGLSLMVLCKGMDPSVRLCIDLMFVLLGAIIKISTFKERNLETYCFLHCTVPILNRFISDIETEDGIHMLPGLGTFSDNRKEMKKELIAERLLPQCRRFKSSVSLNTLRTNKQGVYYADVKAYKIVVSNRHLHEECIYDGAIIVCRMDKPVLTKTTIVTTKYLKPGKESSEYLPVREKINTGYGQFDDNFDVCADSQRTVLEILTQETMEQLLSFKWKYPRFCMILIEDYMIFSTDQIQLNFGTLDKKDPAQHICDDFRELLNITKKCRKIFENEKCRD